MSDVSTGDIMEMLVSLRKQVTQIQNKVKVLESNFKKKMKQTNKVNDKIKAPRKPSGFARPSKVTDKLADFMNKEAGTLVARTEVTQYLIKYIKENSLQNKENKRIIKPDDKLMDLLESGENEITYFNLQKYMNKHFIKE
jgi:upstream activation factor subunit UAF30|tara:strand:+ start:58 stop:477 length:420 start_codon:yes stop_codon:yes gene_type:complete